MEVKSKRWVSANLLIARICEFCERLMEKEKEVPTLRKMDRLLSAEKILEIIGNSILCFWNSTN